MSLVNRITVCCAVVTLFNLSGCIIAPEHAEHRDGDRHDGAAEPRRDDDHHDDRRPCESGDRDDGCPDRRR